MDEFDSSEVSIKIILESVLRKNLMFIIWILALTVLLYFFSKNLYISTIGISLFFFGYVASVVLHEYLHILVMKIFGIKRIAIRYSFLKISVITDNEIRGIKLIVVSLAGPVGCLLVSFLVRCVYHVISCEILQIIYMIYFLHVINLIPIFGDGKMIIKGFFTIKKKKG